MKPELLVDHLGREDATEDANTLALVYRELHGLASRLMASERSTHTLQPTALVHEVWLKLMVDADAQNLDQDELRRRFLALAARGMRQVLVDYARKHRAAKRGGGAAAVTFFEPAAAQRMDEDQLLDLEEAICSLESRSPRLARLAELRLFAGLSPAEASQTLGVSKSTAIDDWALARALLTVHLQGEDSSA